MDTFRHERFGDADDVSTSSGTVLDVRYNPGKVLCAREQFWYSRSRMEKVLLILVFLALLVVVALAIAYGVKDNETNDAMEVTHTDVCLSRGCVEAANSLSQSMDTTVDPCENFHLYACGKWIESHPLPLGKITWSPTQQLDDDNEWVLRNILERNTTVANAGEHMARIYYKSCMDRAQINARSTAPMEDLIQEFQSYKGSSLQAMVEYLYKLGIQPFFAFGVGPEPKNNSIYILQIGEPSQANRWNTQLQEDTGTSQSSAYSGYPYYNFMVDVQVLLGRSRDTYATRMADVFQMILDLENMQTPEGELDQNIANQYETLTVAELQNLAFSLNWTSFFNNLLKVADFQVTASTPIIVGLPNYFKNLSEVVTLYQSTPHGQRIMSDFMEWQLISEFVSALSKDFTDLSQDLQENSYGTEASEERWRTCATDTESIFGLALAPAYIEETFPGHSRDMAIEMLANIKSAFYMNLKTLQWLDSTTKRNARDKANAMVDHIGYPDVIYNRTYVDDKYKTVSMVDTQYFENYKKKKTFLSNLAIAKIKEIPRRDSWDVFSSVPQETNAFYSPQQNQMVFPAGHLRPPFFNREYPGYINYGSMGSIMGHELTHGFDSTGRQFDKEGRLHNWWTNISLTEFESRSQCLIQQYSKFQVGDNHVDGRLTLGENIADNGGLKIAYYAYKSWRDSHGPDKKLPGFELTDDQLFFLSFGQAWCNILTDEYAQILLTDDVHSPDKYRILGPLMNSEEFGAAFSCPRGSQMNPDEKCRMW